MQAYFVHINVIQAVAETGGVLRAIVVSTSAMHTHMHLKAKTALLRYVLEVKIDI